MKKNKYWGIDFAPDTELIAILVRYLRKGPNYFRVEAHRDKVTLRILKLVFEDELWKRKSEAIADLILADEYGKWLIKEHEEGE